MDTTPDPKKDEQWQCRATPQRIVQVILVENGQVHFKHVDWPTTWRHRLDTFKALYIPHQETTP